MKITKFAHSCLLIETPDRVALFDPGVMSTPNIQIDTIGKLDDIFITHVHADHLDAGFIKQLVAKFPQARVTSGSSEVVAELAKEGVTAGTEPPEGVSFFDSPHENVRPLYPQPEQQGLHYLNTLTHPGDSHSFKETKAILALPITAPWGHLIRAASLGLELKPQHIVPIHDWHWRDEALSGTYDHLESLFKEQGITFHKLQTGQPVDIAV